MNHCGVASGDGFIELCSAIVFVPVFVPRRRGGYQPPAASPVPSKLKTQDSHRRPGGVLPPPSGEVPRCAHRGGRGIGPPEVTHPAGDS